MTPYRSRSIRARRRRSAADLDGLLQTVRTILAEQSGAITIRHLFYLTVAAGAVEKTERGYKNLVHQLGKWRRARAIDWTAFADSTRWYYGRLGAPSMQTHLEESIRTYRYSLWEDSAHHVELWCEKDAIASILFEAADPWRVQVLPLRGYASLTSLANAAEMFRDKAAEGKKVHVYYFGDFDPSGTDIDRAAIATLREDFSVDVDYQRVAVTAEQITTYQLPTRPTKQSDTRAPRFVGDSVEIDAMPRDILLALAEECITQHLPADALARLRATEGEERASARAFLAAWIRRRQRGQR